MFPATPFENNFHPQLQPPAPAGSDVIPQQAQEYDAWAPLPVQPPAPAGSDVIPQQAEEYGAWALQTDVHTHTPW